MNDRLASDLPVVASQTESGDEQTNGSTAQDSPNRDSPGRAATDNWPIAAAEMLDADRNARAMGMTISDVVPGSAIAEMIVRPEMLNGHAICHGGIIFMLADTAMAFASNAYGPSAVAAGASIEYLRPARVGDRLTAHAAEAHRAGRNALYDVTVTGADGLPAAMFRGRTRIIVDA